jgi:hypothetical protein
MQTGNDMPFKKLKKLSPDEYAEWDALIDESRNGTIFHKSWWIDSTSKCYEIIGYYKGDELVGGVVLPYTKKYGLKIVHHPPLTPYLGPIYGRKGKKVNVLSDQKEFLTLLSQYIKERFSGVRIFSSPTSMSLLPFLMEKFNPIYKYTYILNLVNIEKVWEDMDKKTRNSIKSATKSDIEVLEGNLLDVLYFVKKTFKREKLRLDFDIVVQNLNNVLVKKKAGKCFVALDSEGRRLSSICVVWDTNRAYYLLGGYDDLYKHRGATSLLLWHSINFVRNELGITEFDFEGSKIPRIERFFRNFGGSPIPILGIQWTKPYLNFSVIMSLMKVIERLRSI